MDLAVHIKELLHRHDCVIIPELGAIVANYEPAEINYARKTIYPPYKSILFNRNLKYNDGLLIGHMANTSGMTIQEAQSHVEKTVREIKTDLAQGKRYVMEDLGYFYPDQKKIIQFLPDLKTNLNLDSFGLSFVHYRNEVMPLKSLKYDNLEAGTQRSHYRAGVRKWIYTAAAASVITAVIFITIPFGPAVNRLPDTSSVSPFKNNRTEIPVGDKESGTSASTVTEVQHSDNHPSGTTLISGTLMHHVIVGSYNNFGNAREQICKLRSAGWSARLLFATDDMYRVSVFSSDNMEESLKQLQVVRTGMNRSAWLYSE